MSKNVKRSDPSNSSWKMVIVSILKGGLLGTALIMLALFLGALLISVGILPEHTADRIVLICCVLGSLTGGLFSVHAAGGGRAMPAGIGAGGMLFLILVLGGLIAHRNGLLLQNGAGQAIACLCGGTMAGILGRTPKKRRRR